jgi:hypothetical protein
MSKKYIKKTENLNMGRPKIKIDWSLFKKLCAMQCTLVEIAGFFDCSEDTIENRIKEEFDGTFSETYKRFSSEGKISLRRTQFTLAKKNTVMAIFLGKQYLGQTDKQELGLTRPINVIIDADDANA